MQHQQPIRDAHHESSRRGTYAAGISVMQMGDRTRPLMVREGWGTEERTLEDGRLQIIRFLLPGDVTGIGGLDGLANVDVRAVTRFRLSSALADPEAGSQAREAAAVELRIALDARDSQLLSQIVGLGRLTALERTAGFLFQLSERLGRAGLSKGRNMPLPLTQQQMADHLGLSVVHVNRTLQSLRRTGLIELHHGFAILVDRHGLGVLAAERPAA